MTQKRIVFDARLTGYSGIGRYIEELLAHMGKPGSGCQITCLVPDRPGPGRSPDPFPALKVQAPVFSLREQVELPLKIDRDRYDLMHGPHFNLPLFSRVPQVLTVHDCAFDLFPEECPHPMARLYHRLVFPAAVKKARRIITISESSKGDLIRCYGISEEKIKVIYLGVDARFFHEMDRREICRWRREFRLDEEFALYVGLTRPRKNLERMLRAFARYLKHGEKKIKLVLAGKIDRRFLDVAQLAAQLGIRDFVVQLGFLPDRDLGILYRAASFLLFPSLYEGFGLPVLEAMAAGTPVITSKNSSLPEVAGDAAWLVDPRDVEEMARAIHCLVNDDHLRQELSKRGRERTRIFSWDKCARETLAVYEGIGNEEHQSIAGK